MEWKQLKCHSSVSWATPYSLEKNPLLPAPHLECLEAELDGTEEGRSSVCLSTRLTGINWPGSQPFSTLLQDSCQAREQNKIYCQISQQEVRNNSPQATYCLSQLLVGMQTWNQQAWQIESTFLINIWSLGQAVCVQENSVVAFAR